MAGARLSEILNEAEALHSATEAAQLADVSWLRSELDALALTDDETAAWRARVDLLDGKVCVGLGRFETMIKGAPTEADNAETADFASRIEEHRRRLEQIWEEIETEELHFVLAHPKVLCGRSEPLPPHIRTLAKTVREAEDFCRRASAGPAPSGLLDLADALVDLSRRLGVVPERVDDATDAGMMAVALLRALMRARPEAAASRLGTTLIVLAQSHLANGDVDQATEAAVEARAFVKADEMPEEVLGLAEAADLARRP